MNTSLPVSRRYGLPLPQGPLARQRRSASTSATDRRVFVGQLAYYSDLSDISAKGTVFSAAWNADYNAWLAASNYRAANKP
jgi:hypothetical protein